MAQKKKDPSFPFYASDWLGSQAHAIMTPVERSAYLDLLCHQWMTETCSLPDDDEVLARLSGMGEGWFSGGSQVVRKWFPPILDQEGFIGNVRLLECRREREEWRDKSRKGGLKSGQQRKLNAGKGGSTTLGTKSKPNGNTPSPFPIDINIPPIVPQGTSGVSDGVSDNGAKCKVKQPNEYSRIFLEFWEAYPSIRKTKKPDAWKAWQKAVTRAMPAVILGAAKEFAKSPLGRSKFCPGPGPWLNQDRWEDDRQSWQRSGDDDDAGPIEEPYKVY